MLPALVIVVAAEIRAVTAAAAVQAAIAEEGFTGVARLVVRTDDAVIGSGRIAEVLDLALVGSMGADPGLRSGRDRGIDPRRLRRRTRALARDVIEWATSVPDRPAELFAPGHVGRTRADERPRAVGRIGPAGDEVVPAEAVA